MNGRIVQRLPAAVLQLLIMLWVLTCIFPFVWMAYSSLKTEPEFARNIMALPAVPSFSNYLTVFSKTNLLRLYFNSIRNVLISMPILILCSFTIGYTFSRYTFRMKQMLRIFLVFGLLIPIHGILVPLYIQFNFLSLLNHWFTLIIPYVATGMAVSVSLIEGYISNIPYEIEEAAIIDSCSLFQRIFLLVLPLSSPILAVDIILHFLAYWNEFPFALVLSSGEEFRTIMLGITVFEGQYSQIFTEKMAFLIMVILPIICIYVLFNKKIIQGMTAGAVKG